MSEEIIARIQQGRLRGKKVTSAAGGEYYSFQGIPYAKPPLGPLRFRPPERPEKWDGIRDASKEGNPSLGDIFGRLIGNEDCLFLNVYTPEWPVKNSKPIMFWIHGGGFIFGSGDTDLYGPDFLVAEDIIVVTVNYRLGALGFLSLDGSDVTTNNGLRDQVMALIWVKENIEHFGGDPSNVTIFGDSAGGVSVHCLMLSPLAEGLFHRAIAMSGTSILPICFTSHDVINQRSLRLGKLLGCTSEDPQKIADYLRTVPGEDILKNQYDSMSEKDKLRLLTFSYTLTEEINGTLLPDHPIKLMEQGKFIKVPFIAGVTSTETQVTAFAADLKPAVKSEEYDSLDLIVPTDLATEIGTERCRQISEKLKSFYFGDLPANEESSAQYAALASDIVFTYPLYATLHYHLKSSESPVYVYMFDHSTPLEMVLFPELAIKPVPGSLHAEDLSYLFFTGMKPNIVPQGSAEAKVRSHLVKYWTQFAKTGDLSKVPNKLPWPPATKDKFQYLKIQENLTLETDFFKKRMEFLDDLYNTFKRVAPK